MATYKIIEGTFHVKGYEPDGDSIRFRAKNPAHWQFLKFASKEAQRRPFHQLRIEAIDSLETHYEGVQQPRAFALAALERMLELMGITEVQYNFLLTTITEAEDNKPGFIATAGHDRFERPIAFVFPPDAGLEDGAEIPAEQLPVEKSVNFTLAREAIVYPTFYTTMEPVLLDKFQRVFRVVREQNKGLWAIDRTPGFRLMHPEVVIEDVIVMPKIFRRLVSFFKVRGDFTGFGEYITKNWTDKLKVNGKDTRLRDCVSWNAQRRWLALHVAPEEILFVPE